MNPILRELVLAHADATIQKLPRKAQLHLIYRGVAHGLNPTDGTLWKLSLDERYSLLRAMLKDLYDDAGPYVRGVAFISLDLLLAGQFNPEKRYQDNLLLLEKKPT